MMFMEQEEYDGQLCGNDPAAKDCGFTAAAKLDISRWCSCRGA
jgi:hypothetical protein